MTTFPNMGLTLPTRGAPGSGIWGDTDDANWAKVDAHDHSSGKGLPIPVAGLNINADLPFSSLWAPTQLHRVQFSAIAAGGLTAGQRTSLFVSDGTSGLVANELYWHNSAGNKVQFTSGNTLNFAAFVGGIGGDYTSVGATLNYVDAQKAYEFREGTGDSNRWARLRSGDLRLFPFNGAGSIFVGQAAPAAIAGSYTMTWPLALPGAQSLLQVDNIGQLSFSTTTPTLTGGIVVTGGGNITGNLTVTGNLSVTGTLTYGDVESYSVAFGIVFAPAAFTAGSSAGAVSISLGVSGTANLPLRPRGGTTITAWNVRCQKLSGAGNTLTAKLWKVTSGIAAAVPTQIGATQTNSAASPGAINLGQSSLSEVVATNTSYFVEVLSSASGSEFVVDYQLTTA
jgi:hypothetical protein